MSDLSIAKKGFIISNGEKVYKLFVSVDRSYKIIKGLSNDSSIGLRKTKSDSKMYIYEIPYVEFLDTLCIMERAKHRPYLDRYNTRVITYLQKHYFPITGSAKKGFNISALIRRANADIIFLDNFKMERE